jgi:hypothetical protein
LAAGCTESPHDASITDTLNDLNDLPDAVATLKALPLIHDLVRIGFCWLAGSWVDENAVIGVVVSDHPGGHCHEQNTSAMGDSDQ